MSRYCIQRRNAAAAPPRFEWLDKAPTFNPTTAEVASIKWTADPAEAKAFSQAAAAEWANIIDDASVVRFGDAEPEEVIDFAAQERARKQAKREERAARERGAP